MSYSNEAQLVQAFASRMERQLAIRDHGDELEGIVIGHELNLPSAGAGGNAGSLDLLLLEPSGELWAIEAKLARNSQSNPEYVFGNQLIVTFPCGSSILTQTFVPCVMPNPKADGQRE